MKHLLQNFTRKLDLPQAGYDTSYYEESVRVKINEMSYELNQ